MLLEQYCQHVARQRVLVEQLNELDRQEPANIQERMLRDTQATKLEERLHKHAMTSGSLAARLRLSIQHTIDRRSGMLDERAPVDDDDRLFAGRQLDS